MSVEFKKLLRRSRRSLKRQRRGIKKTFRKLARKHQPDKRHINIYFDNHHCIHPNRVVMFL